MRVVFVEIHQREAFALSHKDVRAMGRASAEGVT